MANDNLLSEEAAVSPVASSPQLNFHLTIARYNELPSVLPRLALACVVTVSAAVFWACRIGLFKGLTGEPSQLVTEKAIYLAYIVAFMTMWALYFLSRSDKPFFRFRTLRRLLLGTTVNWAHTITEYLGDGAEEQKKLAALELFERKFKEKSTSSMTNLGMLIGAAALELGQISVVSHWHDDTGTWARFTLGVGAVSAITALIFFIVAADSLDSLFNHFRSDDDRHILIRYFYIRSVNPRYVGLMSLLVAATMLIADVSPRVGAISVAIITFAGYPHWFPSQVSPEAVVAPYKGLRSFLTLVLIIVPLLPRLLHGLIK
jgi:hypothetical protein